MDIMQRRKHLKVHDTPDRNLEFVSTLSARFRSDYFGDTVILHVRYVADRQVLDGDSFYEYLKNLETIHWATPETVTATVLNDCFDVLVARWMEVIIDAGSDPKSANFFHHIKVEDRQPGWDNSQLLSRLPTL